MKGKKGGEKLGESDVLTGTVRFRAEGVTRVLILSWM